MTLMLGVWCLVWSPAWGQPTPTRNTVDASETDPNSGDSVFEPQTTAPTNDYDRAVALNQSGEFAEAATLFDQVHQNQPDLSVLLRSAIAWYQGGFFSAAVERLLKWKAETNALGDQIPEGLAARKPVVDALLAKVRAKVFKVKVELPEDVYRPRAVSVAVSVSRLSDGFVPPSKNWVVNVKTASQHELQLEAGRWLFEIQSPIYERQAEVIEVFDDSPLMLAPIPNGKMPGKSAPTDERIAYREALDQFRSADFRAAVKTMEEMVPNGLISEEAIWLYARANENGQRWMTALRAYQRLLERHPKSLEAEVIRAKFPELKAKAEASRAPITIEIEPPAATLTLVQDGERLPFKQSQKVYPGRHVVEASWSSGARDTLTIDVKPKKAQVFKLTSMRANEKLRAMRWNIDGQLNMGLAMVTGNQAETVALGGGPAMSVGVQVGWLWSEVLRLDGGLVYQFANTVFDIQSGSGLESESGSWAFHYVGLPLGVTWISPIKTTLSVGTRVDTLVYAAESYQGNTNISGDSRALNLAPYIGVRHPVTVMGQAFAVEAQYARQLMPLTKADSKLRLQQLTVGVTAPIF